MVLLMQHYSSYLSPLLKKKKSQDDISKTLPVTFCSYYNYQSSTVHFGDWGTGNQFSINNNVLADIYYNNI